jgi:hypothetical protein
LNETDSLEYQSARHLIQRLNIALNTERSVSPVTAAGVLGPAWSFVVSFAFPVSESYMGAPYAFFRQYLFVSDLTWRCPKDYA